MTKCRNFIVIFLKSALDLIAGIKTPPYLITKLYTNFVMESMDIPLGVSRINTTIHMYLTVRSGTDPLGDVPGGLSLLHT